MENSTQEQNVDIESLANDVFSILDTPEYLEKKESGAFDPIVNDSSDSINSDALEIPSEEELLSSSELENQSNLTNSFNELLSDLESIPSLDTFSANPDLQIPLDDDDLNTLSSDESDLNTTDNLQEESESIDNLQEESESIDNLQEESESIDNLQEESESIDNLQEESESIDNLEDSISSEEQNINELNDILSESLATDLPEENVSLDSLFDMDLPEKDEEINNTDTSLSDSPPESDKFSLDNISIEQPENVSIDYFNVNLDKILPNFKTHVLGILSSKNTEPGLKTAITAELNKKDFNTIYLYNITNFDPNKKPFNLFESLRRILIGSSILALILLATYFIFFESLIEANSNLKEGLKKINFQEFEDANKIFNMYSPSQKWYNRYAEAFMEQNALQLAQDKLMGNKLLKLKGAIDIDPYNTRTILDIAELRLRKHLYSDAILAPQGEMPDYSLTTLYNHNLNDIEILDRLAQAYIKWGKYLVDKPKKQEELFSKAHSFYFNVFQNNNDNKLLLSRLLEVSLLRDKMVVERVVLLQKKGLLQKINLETLAKLGLYYLNKGELTNATMIFNLIKNRLNKGTNNPTVYYMIGQFYLVSNQLNEAEANFIQGVYHNSNYSASHEFINAKNPELQARLDNALGQLYLQFSHQYKYNNKKFNRLKELALYHFAQAYKNDPENPETYYLSGNMAYEVNQNYEKAQQKLDQAYQIFKKNHRYIPDDLRYHLGYSFYKTEQYQKALTVLLELESNRQNYYPSLEYLIGMVYINLDMNDAAIDQFNKALDYFKNELDKIKNQAKDTLANNYILHFTAIIHNNLGVLYQLRGLESNNAEFKTLARAHFYQALENANRINQQLILTEPRLNLNDSFLENNKKYANNFALSNRKPSIYEFAPSSLGDYL